MKEREDYTKLRGGYYTPEVISKFISKWAIRTQHDCIMEPSCGDGSFVKSIVETLLDIGTEKDSIKKKVYGIELDANEAKKAEISGASIINSDFFSFYMNNVDGKMQFDAVVGNPPFIRYQNFIEEYRKKAFDLIEKAGMHPNRLTNIWVPFLILSCECLKDNGRLGMVIPAELFQVDYAAETRQYLSEKFEHLLIITFDKLLFNDAQQEVVLLLGEKKSTKKGIEVIELKDASELENLTVDLINVEIKELDHTSEKWVKYYLSNKELMLIRKLQNDIRFTSTMDLFEVNVGVVSGQNDFFIINEDVIKEYGLENSVQPIIGKADQLKGIKLEFNDLYELQNTGKKVFLYEPQDIDFDKLPDCDKHYISWGEKQNYHTGYKCRIRKRWYIVPRSWDPDAFMLRQVHKYPKIVFNNTNATNTDTLHKIRFLDGVNGEIVSAAFLNSFTFAQCELTGRSYGGGVLTFEPGEVRKLKIPMKGSEDLDIKFIDKKMRQGKIYDVLQYTDEILLKKNLGMCDDDIITLRNIWEKMSNRRINRKAKKK